MSNDLEIYEKVCGHCRETALLAAAEATLGWDERTMLPPAGAEFRSDQMALLSGLIHRRRTDKQLGEWLAALADSPLANDLHSTAGANIRQLKWSYDRAVRLPAALVEELARTASLGQHVWEQARREDSFAQFAPILTKTIQLKREQADALGHLGTRYDALLEDYEPHERTANLTQVLASLREALVPLVAEIAAAKRRPDETLLNRFCSVESQTAFGREVAAAIGFDFNAGRLDVTAHPFCTTLGPHDTRLTTRYEENFFPGALFGTMHEAGHGMYEQGLSADQFGLPAGEAVSLGIHESQSRLWENLVGRSHAFWRYFLPKFQQAFAASYGNVGLDDLYGAINVVKPSLIRVEADEATYNLHILIRFELEQALLSDDLQVADLPQAWREKYQQYLGVASADDADGCLQDVHWSAGLFGYFPTYSLGNLYAAQFFEAAATQLGDLHAQFSQGKFLPLRDWLREKIHAAGQCYTAKELVQRVTGRPLSHEPLMRHLRDKLTPLYGL